MNFTELIKNLRKVTLDKNSILDKETHYKSFAEVLHCFFEKEMGESYLFSFPFVSEKGDQKNPSHSYLISSRFSEQRKENLKDHFIKGEEVLKEKGAISLTKLMIENLVEEEIQSILLKIGGKKSKPVKENKIISEYYTEFIIIDLRERFKTEEGCYTSYFKEIAKRLKVFDSAKYEALFARLEQFFTIPASPHFFYLIKPTANHMQFNVVLALGLKLPLKANEFHMLRLLIYRFVSEVAIKELEQIEELKRKKSFSLTTHAFKTEINTTLIPQVANVKKLASAKTIEKFGLTKEIFELEEQCTDLFHLTGIISLIDKINEKEEFISSGRKDGLIKSSKQTSSILKHCENYNLKNKNLDNIILSGDENTVINIKIYNEYLSEQIIRLFCNMVFENLNLYAERNQKKITLKVSQSSEGLIFENDADVETFNIDEKQLKGNLLLFKTLIEETKSGNLSIEAKNKKFKLILNLNDE